MRRKLVCVLLTAAVLAGLAVRTRAAEAAGSISVTLDYGDGQVHEESLVLYRVGSAEGDAYRLTEAFGGGLIRKEDIQSQVLARWLAAEAAGDSIQRILDADSNAYFSDLAEGLYLLVQEETAPGCSGVNPFLIPMPCYGQWQVTALPKVQKLWVESPNTGQHPAPILGAMGLVLSGLGLILCAERFRRK